jgi:hypothetical protein
LLFCPNFKNNNNNNNSNNNNDNNDNDCNNNINNSSGNNQQPKLVIEIDEDSDIEILSYYNNFEIIQTEKSPIKYENPEEAPKTIKITMTLRDPYRQIKFRIWRKAPNESLSPLAIARTALGGESLAKPARIWRKAPHKSLSPKAIARTVSPKTVSHIINTVNI